MAFVSITRLRIRSLRFLPRFLFDTLATRRQLERADGFVAGALLADRKHHWTMTVWRDQRAMRDYMASGAHLKAMPKLLDWCDEASVVHWSQDSPSLPDWHEADRRMRAEGRASKVRHPSSNHAPLSYDAPRTSAAVPMRPTKAA